MVLSMESTTGSGLENVELEHSTQGRRSTNVEQDHKQVEEEGGEMKRMGCMQQSYLGASLAIGNT